MIIQSSSVGMSSNRRYSYYEDKKSISMSERADQAVVLDISREALSLSDPLQGHQKQQETILQQNYILTNPFIFQLDGGNVST